MQNLNTKARGESVTLIGMAGVGKSTIGAALARRQGLRFVDTDDLIREQSGLSLSGLIEAVGLDVFLEKEAAVILALEPAGQVIATGGSAVYVKAAMEHLKASTRIVWLQQDSATLKKRLGAASDARGVARRDGQSVEDLIKERLPLYAHYADIEIACGCKTPDEIVELICSSLPCNSIVDARVCCGILAPDDKDHENAKGRVSQQEKWKL